jgi:type II secretory pathway component PulK
VSERGIALLVVTFAISLIFAIGSEFTTKSNEDLRAAVHARANMQAEFMLRSGVNLSQLLVRLQMEQLDPRRDQIGDIQIADYTGFFMGAFGGSEEEVSGIGDMLGGFSEDALKSLGTTVGTFDLQISTEDGKMNLNCANGSAASKEVLKTQLEALLYFEAYNPLFESEDADGWRRTREEQVAALMDYVDTDRAKADAPGSSEEYGYQSLRDRYDAKDNYVDSLGEIALIRGVDDRFWTLFGPALTTYGACKVNIGALKDPKQIAAVILLAAKSQEDPVVRDPVKLWALARHVAESQSMMAFDDLNAFSDFVKNPMGALGEEFAEMGLATPADITQNMPQVDGVELDNNKLRQIAQAGPRRTYRVEVTAEIGEFRKRITAIWDTQVQNQNARDPSNQRGAWVFWREE